MCGEKPAAAQTFDAAADYSTTTATNGVWRYGYTQTLGSSLILYTSNFDHPEVVPEDGRMNYWGTHGPDGDVTPVLGKNLEPEPYYGTTVRPTEPVAGGQMALHPGPSGEFSVLRFIAPSTGNYRINAQFFRGHGGDTDAHILVNSSTAVFYALSTDEAPAFNGELFLSSNDVVDFVVGSKGEHGGDTTPVNIVLTQDSAPAVPEPGALALFLPALAVVALIRRRRA